MNGPIRPLNEDLVSFVKEFYLIPPPENPDRSVFDIDLPVWRKLIDWNKVQKSLIEIYQNQVKPTNQPTNQLDQNHVN